LPHASIAGLLDKPNTKTPKQEPCQAPTRASAAHTCLGISKKSCRRADSTLVRGTVIALVTI